MSALRHNAPGVAMRLRSIRDAKRAGIEPVSAFGRDCAQTTLGQRLGIAAIYGGQGDADEARVVALLACADVIDTPENRRKLRATVSDIGSRVRAAIGHRRGAE